MQSNHRDVLVIHMYDINCYQAPSPGLSSAQKFSKHKRPYLPSQHKTLFKITRKLFNCTKDTTISTYIYVTLKDTHEGFYSKILNVTKIILIRKLLTQQHYIF